MLYRVKEFQIILKLSFHISQVYKEIIKIFINNQVRIVFKRNLRPFPILTASESLHQ